MKFGILMLKATLKRRVDLMSKILELAKEIDKEIHDLKHREAHLENELQIEKEKRKRLLEKIKYLVEEELYNE